MCCWEPAVCNQQCRSNVQVKREATVVHLEDTTVVTGTLETQISPVSITILIPDNNWVKKRTPGILALLVTCDPGRSGESPTQVEPPPDQPQNRCIPRMHSSRELSRVLETNIFLLQSTAGGAATIAGRVQLADRPQGSLQLWLWKLSSLVCTWKRLGRPKPSCRGLSRHLGKSAHHPQAPRNLITGKT